MEGIQAFDNLDKGVPDLLLWEKLSSPFLGFNMMGQIAAVGEFHYNATSALKYQSDFVASSTKAYL